MSGPAPSLSPQSTLRSAPSREAGGIAIADIEASVVKLRSGWPDGATLRDIATVFAMLKVGSSVGRLRQFTGYDSKFIYDLVEQLRRHGKLMTGAPSARFVLSQCPGAEELIEAITGAPACVPDESHQAAFAPPSTTSKGARRMSTTPSAPEIVPVAQTESKPDTESCWCGREPKNHRGLHREGGAESSQVCRVA
jgi:hypothetical protein